MRLLIQLATIFIVSSIPHAHAYFYSSTDSFNPESQFLTATRGLSPLYDKFPLQIILIGSPPPPLTLADAENALREAVQQWNDISCSYAQMYYAGHIHSIEERDWEQIPIVFADPDDSNQSSCLDNATIANTTFGCLPDTYAAIFLNTQDIQWSSTPHPQQPRYADTSSTQTLIVDFPSVIVHELGHVLGLGHSNIAGTTMAARYLPDGIQQTLTAHDKLDLCKIYSLPDNPIKQHCTSDAACPKNQQCISLDSHQICGRTPPTIGDYCADDLPYCSERCLHPDPSSKIGYCSAHCLDDEDCPTYFSCQENLEVPEREDTFYCIMQPPRSSQRSSCSLSSHSIITRFPSHIFFIVIVLVLGIAGKAHRAD